MKRLAYRCPACNFFGDLFGAEWPAWVRAADGKSGVYVIRDRSSKRVLYVGESHSDRLKKTLLRHFQHWTGRTAGNTYSRNSVEIAIEVTPAGKAVARQNALICQLEPRDNVQGTACEDEDPF